MEWIALTSMEQLDEIQQAQQKVMMFKHSTRCPISGMAKRGLEFDFDSVPEGTLLYFLDLIKYRDIPNAVAERWGVRHESPQLLVLHEESCVYHASHEDVDMSEALKHL